MDEQDTIDLLELQRLIRKLRDHLTACGGSGPAARPSQTPIALVEFHH